MIKRAALRSVEQNVMRETEVKLRSVLSISEQRKCQKNCKSLFKEFRGKFFVHDTVQSDLEGKQFEIDMSDVSKAGVILKDMNTLLSFEGMPPSDGGSVKQQQMRHDLVEAINIFIDTKIWPDELNSESSRYKFFLVALQTGGEDLITEMKKEIENQKRLYPDSDCLAFETDLIRAQTMFADQTQGEGGQRTDAEGEIVDESLLRFDSQDGNVDCAFHFIIKLVEANSKPPSLKVWKEMLSVVKGAGGRLLKQNDVIKKLQRTDLPIIKDLVFDSQNPGGRMHKYQHPLMISPKMV